MVNPSVVAACLNPASSAAPPATPRHPRRARHPLAPASAHSPTEYGWEHELVSELKLTSDLRRGCEKPRWARDDSVLSYSLFPSLSPSHPRSRMWRRRLKGWWWWRWWQRRKGRCGGGGGARDGGGSGARDGGGGGGVARGGDWMLSLASASLHS